MRNPKAGNSYQAALLRIQLLSLLPRTIAIASRDGAQRLQISGKSPVWQLNSIVLRYRIFFVGTRIEKNSFLELPD